MPIQLRLLLWYYNHFLKVDHRKMTAAAFRQSIDKSSGLVKRLLEGAIVNLPKIENLQIDGKAGAIPIRLYFPNDKKNLPVILFIHGGGFMLHDLEGHDQVCRQLCRDNEAIIVAVDYRRAPEHKFPAAVEDSFDAAIWVTKNIEKYGGDAKRLALMGDSAGGNLVAVICQMARNTAQINIAAQVLIYPVIDARMQHPSVTENALGYILEKDLMAWFLEHYRRTEADILDPKMSPILAEDVSGLPPTLVQVAEFDPLRDEGIDYAEKLNAAGNHVQLTNYKGLVHTYFSMPNFLKKAREAHTEVKEFLSKWL